MASKAFNFIAYDEPGHQQVPIYRAHRRFIGYLDTGSHVRMIK